jgi:EmrB/QacA subfamily drug resistance transporter
MNKYERQSRQPADHQLLSDELASELSRITTEVLEFGDAPPLAPRAPLTQSEVRTILLSLMLTMFLAALDQTIVATALPTIGRQFQDVSSLSWVITAYLLASTAVAPVFGTLSDIYGRRAMIIVALSLFIAGSVLCGLAPNMTVLILARGLQGLGGGGIMPIVQTVISDVVTPRERGQYQAYFSGVWTAAGIGGPVLGGVFAEHLHWSMVFWINLPLGAVALATLLPKMRKIPVFHRKREVDWLGGILLMASAVVFMLVLTWGGNRFLWLSPTILAMLGSSVALTFAFVWHARNFREPFLPLPLLGGSVVPYAMAAGGCAMGAIIGLTVHLPLYYEVVYHLSASEAGLALIPLAAVSTCGAAIAGKTMARAKHYKRVAIIGLSGAALVGCIFTFATLSLWALLALLALFALGLGTAAKCGVAGAGRNRDRRDEFLPRADGFIHGGGVQRHPAHGARCRYFAWRRASRYRQLDSCRRHDRVVPLCVCRCDGAAGHRIAVHGRDGGAAAGRTGQATGHHGGVGACKHMCRQKPTLPLTACSVCSLTH